MKRSISDIICQYGGANRREELLGGKDGDIKKTKKELKNGHMMSTICLIYYNIIFSFEEFTLSIMLVFAASDVFSHSLELGVRDKILLTVCAPLLVPFRIFVSLLLAFFIWSSSRLGLLFSNPEVRNERTG